MRTEPELLFEDDRSFADLARSKESLDFEAMWRSLPRTGRIPQRSAFHPRLAKPFLRHLILAQAPSPDDPRHLVRLAGDAICQEIMDDIAGQDFFDLMEGEARKARALFLVRKMFEALCGIWWVAPVVYGRGHSQYWELTSFPLGACEISPAMVLTLAKPFGAPVGARTFTMRAVRIDEPLHLEPIVVGT